jgi:uncharacterized protein (DUF983 family)
MPALSYPAALLQGKCPRCRKGDIFTYPVIGHLFQFNKMNETCPHCEVRLEPEPGFYQGAMYVGYGITVMVIILVSLVLYFFADGASAYVYMFTVIGVMILLIPFNYRYSRIIYLYLFGGIGFDSSYSQ